MYYYSVDVSVGVGEILVRYSRGATSLQVRVHYNHVTHGMGRGRADAGWPPPALNQLSLPWSSHSTALPCRVYLKAALLPSLCPVSRPLLAAWACLTHGETLLCPLYSVSVCVRILYLYAS